MLKSINVINHTSGLKDKDHMITSIEEQKNLFDKTQYTFMIKVLGCVGLEGIYLNMIKAIYGKHTANSIGNGETLEVITLKGMRPEHPCSPLLEQLGKRRKLKR